MAKSRAYKNSAEATPHEENKGAKKSTSEAAAAEERAEKKQRPSRERKQVERYFEPYPRRASVLKNPTIEQGPGVKLRDIPTVLFKLSKRKVDDTLNVLHTILFGRKSNVKFVKRNILQFSGYVWPDNEEKQKVKVKEKLEKCTKDKLLGFCQLFDIPINKRITKKEEASEKLLEFLESPYVSSDVVIEEKEQEGNKRKRTKELIQTTTVGEASSDKKEKKKLKRSSKNDVNNGMKESNKANKHDEDGGDSDENHHAKSKPLSKKKNSEKPTVSGGPKTKKKTSFLNKCSSAKSDKNTSKSNLKASSASQDESKAPARSKKVSFNKPTRQGSKSAAKEKAALSEKHSVKVPKRVSKSSKKGVSAPPSTSKSIKMDNKKGRGDDKPSIKGKKTSKMQTKTPKLSTKEKGKRKVQGKAVKGPSRKDMLPVVSGILKEVDFEVATLADILKKLETHFKVSLMERQEEVKSVIEEVVLQMSDFEETDEDKGNAAHDEGTDDKEVSDGNPEVDTAEDPQEAENPEQGSADGDDDE